MNESNVVQDVDLKRVLEAILMVADHPLSFKEIRDIVMADLSNKDIIALIDELNNEYAQTNRSFCIRNIAGGYRLFVLDEFSPWIRKMYAAYKQERLSRAALEVLSIIAYKQPITKIEIEQIRGVSSDGVIKNLIEKDMIKIEGRKEVPGRPFLYVTTKAFLDYFGLGSLKDLPRIEEFDQMEGQIAQEVQLEIGEIAAGNRENRPADIESA